MKYHVLILLLAVAGCEFDGPSSEADSVPPKADDASNICSDEILAAADEAQYSIDTSEPPMVRREKAEGAREGAVKLQERFPGVSCYAEVNGEATNINIDQYSQQVIGFMDIVLEGVRAEFDRCQEASNEIGRLMDLAFSATTRARTESAIAQVEEFLEEHPEETCEMDVGDGTTITIRVQVLANRVLDILES